MPADRPHCRFPSRWQRHSCSGPACASSGEAGTEGQPRPRAVPPRLLRTTPDSRRGNRKPDPATIRSARDRPLPHAPRSVASLPGIPPACRRTSAHCGMSTGVRRRIRLRARRRVRRPGRRAGRRSHCRVPRSGANDRRPDRLQGAHRGIPRCCLRSHRRWRDCQSARCPGNALR